MHVLATQLVVPFAFVQAVPQAPQFAVLFVMFVSQPSSCLLPLQSAKLAEHVPVHTPAVQVFVDMFVPGQTMLQPPQLVVLVPVFASQPLMGLPSQSEKPPAHTGTHRPATQLVVPCAFAQTMPQPPQFDALFDVMVSQPLFLFASQSPKPAAHTGLHTLAMQLVVPFALVHVVPQPPQFVTLLVVLVSQPSVCLFALQSA